MIRWSLNFYINVNHWNIETLMKSLSMLRYNKSVQHCKKYKCEWFSHSLFHYQLILQTICTLWIDAADLLSSSSWMIRCIFLLKMFMIRAKEISCMSNSCFSVTVIWSLSKLNKIHFMHSLIKLKNSHLWNKNWEYLHQIKICLK